MTAGAQTLLDFDAPQRRESALDRRFREWLDANGHVYDAAVRLARQARAAGRTRCGIKMIFEVLRWEHFLRAQDPEGWALNNNFASRLGREIMRRESDLAGFFHVRELHS